MKTSPFVLFLALSLTLHSAEVKPGDTRHEVQSILGIPHGHLEIAGRELLYFDRGEVELRSGKVTRVSLRSPEDQAALESRRSADAIRSREEQEIRLAHMSVEGEALKARKLADPAFQSAPLSYQLAFWEDFSRRYSSVPAAEQLNLARARLAEQVTEARAQAEQAQRLADLEARVAEAEARAAEANARAVRAVGYYRPYGGWSADRSSGLQIDYRFFDAPLPYATSPGMPPRQPSYRNDPALLQNDKRQNDPSRNQLRFIVPSQKDQLKARSRTPDYRSSSTLY